MTRETRRPGAARRRVGAHTGLAFLLATGACTGDHETRRLEVGDAFERVERDGVTRPALVVGSTFEAQIRDVAPGVFVTSLAVRGSQSGGARARLELHADDLISRIAGRDFGSCEQSWPEPADDDAWQACEIPIQHGAGRLRLTVHFEGAPEAELLV